MRSLLTTLSLFLFVVNSPQSMMAFLSSELLGKSNSCGQFSTLASNRLASPLAASSKDRFDMNELRQRIQAHHENIERQEHRNESPSRSPYVPAPITSVYILLFNPSTENEGVHTIETESGRNVILAFESRVECRKFADLLEAQKFLDPTPQRMNLKRLKQSCDKLAVAIQVIPAGLEVIPPENSVNDWDHSPLLESVHILFFHPGTDEEGVHTIELASGQDVLLAFESLQECHDFADLLRAQQFFDPKPRQMNLQALREHCDHLGVLVRVVPRGTDLIPPVNNVEKLEDGPSQNVELSRLEKTWSYLEDEIRVDLQEPGVVAMNDRGSWD